MLLVNLDHGNLRLCSTQCKAPLFRRHKLVRITMRVTPVFQLILDPLLEATAQFIVDCRRPVASPVSRIHQSSKSFLRRKTIASPPVHSSWPFLPAKAMVLRTYLRKLRTRSCLT